MASPSTPTTIQFIQAQSFVIAGSGASIGDTTLVLQSMVGIDGQNILTADLGSFAYGTLEPGNGTQEEAILFTGVTQNANGTATLTGVQSLGFKTPYTLTAGIQKTHAGASKFILSNDAAFYNNLVLYMNSIAGAGAANASTTVKGIVQAATSSQINSGTPTGSTGAVLAMTPDAFFASQYALATGTLAALAGTSGTPSASNKFVTQAASTFQANFGGGSDGSVTISSPTTLTRDMYYQDLTVSSTLITDGYLVFVAGTLSGTGTIRWGTPNVGNNGSGATGGTAGAAAGSGRIKNIAGAAGGTGSVGANGTSTTVSPGVSGVSGGTGGTGAGSPLTGGTGGTASITSKVGVLALTTLQALDLTSAGVATYTGSASGGGGGSGASDGGNGAAQGGGGGGSGASGGGVLVVASVYAGTITFNAAGANGGTGGVGPAGGGSAVTGGGGGGAGGPGGWIIVVYGSKTAVSIFTITGGTGGTGGVGHSGGGTGVTGTTGTTGASYEIAISNLTR